MRASLRNYGEEHYAIVLILRAKLTRSLKSSDAAEIAAAITRADSPTITLALPPPPPPPLSLSLSLSLSRGYPKSTRAGLGLIKSRDPVDGAPPGVGGTRIAINSVSASRG